MEKLIFLFFSFLLVISCKDSEKRFKTPFYKIDENKKIEDGLYPAELIYLDKNFNELKSLGRFSETYVKVKDNEYLGPVDSELILSPEDTKDPVERKILKEVKLVKYFKIKNDHRYIPQEMRFKN